MFSSILRSSRKLTASDCRGVRWYSQKKSKLRVLEANSHNVLLNIAYEDYIFREGPLDCQTLYLWRNSPTVVIGRHQNPWKECNLLRMEQDGVTLVRRTSGGGAVYQDLGNMNFTFLSPIEEYSKKVNTDIVTGALAEFGVTAEASGRNDILVNGSKVSGSAYRIQGPRAFHHGTLLMHVDLDALQKYLTPHSLKLKSKGVDSVRARVANLRTFNADISYDKLSKALVRQFFKRYDNECEIEPVEEGQLQHNKALFQLYDRLSDWNWRFGETPDFEYQLEHRFQWGMVDLHMDSKDGRITGVKLFSDCLFPDFIDAIQNALQGVAYHRNEISAALLKLRDTFDGLDELKTMLTDFHDWLVQEV